MSNETSPTNEYTPKHKSQFELINQYRSRLQDLSPRNEVETARKKVEIKPIAILEGDSGVRGFRIILNRSDQPKNGLITDWDDTLENYSNRKPRYIDSLHKLINAELDFDKNNFTAICQSINKGARILNWQSMHPECYSPFLEMLTESQLIRDINNNSDNEYYLNLINSPSEETARLYILNRIAPTLGSSMTTKEKNNKLYFQEKIHQSLAHTLEEKHDYVTNAVFAAFNQEMTTTNLTQEDTDIFDLDDSTYWAISTFGAVEFQLKKIVTSLEELQKSGKRMPNEIMIITHGRKNIALKELMDEQPDIDWTYVDDSERQLNSLKKDNTKAKLINAKREGAKRAVEESEHLTTDMKNPLSSLLT